MRLLVAACALLLIAPASAAAQSGTASAAAAALASDTVYVDPAAENALTAAEADDLRAQIRSSEASPLYVAVLPASAADETGGSLEELLRQIGSALGRQGTYVVVAGGELRAASTVLPVGRIADTAIAEHRAEGLAAILSAFVAGVEAELTGAAERPGGGGGGSSVLILFGVIFGAAALMSLVSRRRRRRADAEALATAKHQVRDELVELGEGIGALDLDVELAKADRAAREDYSRAVAAYDQANTAWNRARTVDDLAPVGAALEEGRWALAAAKARLEGRPVPERRAPCFFDPRHGPSTRDVMWGPPGGAARPVPACEADAQYVEQGVDPGFREIDVGGGQMVPYWSAGPGLSPFYAGGMFGGFGIGAGLLGGLMLGSLLSPGAAFGADGWGGDFGGGDFGGGDFGGDFGGGDFGGGDF